MHMSKSAQAEARFCVVCCRHHEQGRSHIFTTKHKTRLGTILTKFSNKVFLFDAHQQDFVCALVNG